MAQYKVSDITKTYWACNDGFKVGRDPMGIQNSSVATYSCLLPGMTNLTGHIRYYSLFCWLLHEYDELEKNGQTDIHQYNFIRRAELTMAFVMKDQNVGSVIGARFIQSQNYDYDEEDEIYYISTGADYEESNKYWTFKSGAFGQYYIGSLIHYELVKLVEGRFYLRDKGKALAAAFINSVDSGVRELFLECIDGGGITEDEITELQPIGLHSIKKYSAEWNMLNDLMTMTDNDGSSLRRESILLMLQDISNGVSVNGFVLNRYKSYQIDDTLEASFGWYFYYLCEALHYSIETLLCFVLNQMDELQNPAISRLIDDTEEKILSNFDSIDDVDNVEDWKMVIDEPIEDLLSDVKEFIKTKEFAKAASKAILLMLRLHDEYRDKYSKIRSFEAKYDLKRQRGILSESLKSYVEQHLHKTIKSYIVNLIQQVMNEHTVVAVGKMGNSNLDLRKFIIEDGCAVLVEVRFPNLTSPRIESLHNFLVDLKYLDNKDGLTQIAEKYIASYGEE